MMPALRASASKTARAAWARANARSRSTSNTAATAAPAVDGKTDICGFIADRNRIQTGALRHRQRDGAIDDRTYQALRRDVDKQIFWHEGSPRVLKWQPPRRLPSIKNNSAWMI
jgi:hypothetical protein